MGAHATSPLASLLIGIAATRVVECTCKPALVLSVEGDEAHGSGRSIHSFHLLDALESMKEIFTKFGGHAHAAGLTLPAEAVESFRERLCAYAAARLTAEEMRPVVKVDAVLEKAT